MDGSPKFNDSLGFLATIRNLINMAHLASGEDNKEEWYIALDQLHTEVYPRLEGSQTDKDTEIGELEILRKKAQSFNREALRNYQLKLNVAVHKHELALIDEGEQLDNW